MQKSHHLLPWLTQYCKQKKIVNEKSHQQQSALYKLLHLNVHIHTLLSLGIMNMQSHSPKSYFKNILIGILPSDWFCVLLLLSLQFTKPAYFDINLDFRYYNWYYIIIELLFCFCVIDLVRGIRKLKKEMHENNVICNRIGVNKVFTSVMVTKLGLGIYEDTDKFWNEEEGSKLGLRDNSSTAALNSLQNSKPFE